jgi:hemerythrin-like domain-containing protein
MDDESNSNDSGTRRRFIQSLGLATVFIAMESAIDNAAFATAPATEPYKEIDVFSPAEVLMRHHGLLMRILLIYGECIRRISAGDEMSPNVIADSAKIIRSFIEDFHEKLEENYLFPKFRKANKHMNLVGVLSIQHKEGRKLTNMMLSLANAGTLQSHLGRQKLTESLSMYIRMFGPHEAREDTILYPAFRTIVKPSEYNALGEFFVNRELEHFVGLDLVDKVASIEMALGIYYLSQFTAHI